MSRHIQLNIGEIRKWAELQHLWRALRTNPLTESEGFSFTNLENAWLIKMFSHAHFFNNRGGTMTSRGRSRGPQ